LVQSLAHLSGKYERFRLIFIVGYSNARGLHLTADSCSTPRDMFNPVPHRTLL
jgi:hypothetical protein